MSGAEIVDGKYAVQARGGVVVGTYSVQITGHRPLKFQGAAAPLQRGGGMDMGEPIAEQYLPAKYSSSRTELKITIPPGSGKITQDFDLTD